MREELLGLASRLRAHALTLVVAPAGSGKTTLLAGWRRRLAERGEASAYLDLTLLHQDAAILTADLAAALRESCPSFGAETHRALADLSGAPEEWRLLARAFLRDRAADGMPLCCFLDNYHELAHDAPAARLLDEWLRAAPANLHWVISTRGSVPGAAGRLRAADAVLELGADDLNLRSDEIQRLLAERGIELRPALAARLLARTEGWATGVQLAARRLARLPASERDAYVTRLGREPDLFGFIAVEVLRDEPEALLAVVEIVALLGRCSRADVAAVSGDPRAAEWIARAVDRGILLSDGQEIWIHQLWRDFVQERAQARLPEPERRALLQRSATALRRRGNHEAALEALVAAEDWPGARDAILEASQHWLREGRAERLRHWLTRLPAELVDETPALLTVHGLAWMQLGPQHALPLLEKAAQMYRRRGDRAQERFVTGALGMIYLSQLRRDDAVRALRRQISLRGLLTEPAERGAVWAVVGEWRLLTGRFRGALAMAERAAALPLEPVADWFNSLALAFMRGVRGEWEGGLEVIKRILERPEIDRHPLFHYGTRLLRARLLVFTGAFDAAREDAERVEQAFREHRLGMLRELSALELGFVSSRRGERSEARRWLEEAAARAGEGAAGMVRATFAIELAHWGECDEAAREARRALESFGRRGDPTSRLFPWLHCYALWVLGRCGEPEEAWRLAQRERARFRDSSLRLTHDAMQLALADLAQRAGALEEARRLARAGFEAAQRAGTRRVDPLVGSQVVPACAGLALRDGFCADWVLDRMAELYPERAPGLLAELAADASAQVRERAVAGLARCGGRSAFEPLRAASQDPERRVRDAALTALAELDLRPSFALRVRTLGGFEVWRGEHEIGADEWRGQTARRLFVRLLVAEGRSVPRERLLGDLWPDVDDEAGRNNLRVATARLNAALDPARPSGAPPYFVLADGEGLRLHGDVIQHWDVSMFRARQREAEDAERRGDERAALALQREALELYRGPFVPEMADEEWAAAPSRELAQRFEAAAHRAGPRWVRRGRLDEALRLADRLLREDAADERAFALRMRAQLAGHDHAGALRTYDAAVAALRRELDLEPGAELADLAAQARSS